MQAIRRRLVVLVGISLVTAACSGSPPVHTGGAANGGSPSSNSPAKSSPPSGWRKVSLPSPPGGPSAGYTNSGSAITCPSATECIFASTYLAGSNSNQFSITASTTNAGLTWTSNTRFPSSLDGGIASTACDHNYCFIVAENAATTNQAVARSIDKGKTWTVLPYPPSWVKDSIDADMIACSSTRCLVYGNDTFAATPTSPSAGAKTAFAATSNDFETWTDIAIPGGGQIDQLACIWSGQCWAEYETPDDDLEHFATTLDGGVTWTALGPISNDNAINNNSDLSFALDPDHQVGLACENTQTCFILDNSNNLVTTHDGGRTWKLAHGPVRGTTDAMTCTPSSTCWIVSVGPPTTAWLGLPPS